MMSTQELIEQEKRSIEKLLNELKEKHQKNIDNILEHQKKEKVKIENLLKDIRSKFRNSDNNTSLKITKLR